jgi:hypothetical protein
LGVTAEASNENETIIIAPENLEGVAGSSIRASDIFVQKITLYEVENITNIEISNDFGETLTMFPTDNYKAIVRRSDTKETLGYINLIPITQSNVIAIGNYGGEFLFYQNGRVFNKLNLSEDGKIYFYKQGETLGERPMILDIGIVKDGKLTYKEYVKTDNNILSLRRD